jgi:hypothetical protein
LNICNYACSFNKAERNQILLASTTTPFTTTTGYFSDKGFS